MLFFSKACTKDLDFSGDANGNNKGICSNHGQCRCDEANGIGETKCECDNEWSGELCDCEKEQVKDIL